MDIIDNRNATLANIFLRAGIKLDIKRWAILLSILVITVLTQIYYILMIESDKDCGFFLTHQYLFNHLGIKHITAAPWWWFSDVVGGWWLKLFGDYGFLGAKIGGAIALGLTCAITANTIFQIYKPTLSVVSAIILAGFCLPNDMLNYVSVPALLFSISTFYFTKMNIEIEKLSYPIFSGVFFALLVFSRVPLIFVLAVPAICFLFCYRMESSQFQMYLRSYLKMYAVIIGSFLIFTLILYAKGLLLRFIFPPVLSEKHTVFSLFSILGTQLIEKAPMLLVISFFASVLYFSIKKAWLSSRYARYALSFLLLSLLTLAVVRVKYPIIKDILRLIWPDAFDVYAIFVSINVICLCLLKRRLACPEVILAIFGLSWPFLSRVGSSTGAMSLIVAGLLLYGMTVILLKKVGDLYRCKTPLVCLATILFLVAGGKGLLTHKAMIQPPLIRISKSHHLAKMEGVYTNPIYAKNLGSLVHEMEKYVAKGDRILAYPVCPMVYFASETLPFGDSPCLFETDINQVSYQLDQIAQMAPPKLIVKIKIAFMTNKVDGTGQIDPDPNRHANFMQKCSLLDEKLLNKWNPQLIWSNECFEIFVPDLEAPSA